MAVSTALIPIETPRDPFWEFSARIYLESIIGYVLESLPEEEHTMDSVVRLSREIGTGRLSKLMDELARRGIPLEMCPTSNVQTKAVGSFCSHPILTYLRSG